MIRPLAIFNTRRWVISSLGTLVALFIIAVLPALTGTLSWKGSVHLILLMWLTWGIFAPLVVELAFHFPLERARLPLNLAVHLIAFCAIFLINQGVTRHFMEEPRFS